MAETTFAAPDFASFLGLDALGLTVTGMRIDGGGALVECRLQVCEEDAFCRVCGAQGAPVGTVARRLAHVPVGWRPTHLLVRLRRWRCQGCGRVWRQDASRAAAKRARLTLAAKEWAIRAVGVEFMSISRVAAALGVSWHTANEAVLERAKDRLINDPGRLKGVEVIGVDEHVWRHTRKGDKYVTVIIDLTPVRDRTGPSRLLDMIEGRSKQAFKQWLQERDEDWRSRIEVVSMDGFAGFKTAAAEALPGATEVMDPFHVVALAGDKLDECRRRTQRETTGRRGRKDDPLYKARRLLRTGAGLVSDKGWERLEQLFADPHNTPVEIMWGVYQKIMAAYRAKAPAQGKTLMEKVMQTLTTGVPDALEELKSLGKTLAQRREDILAYFDHRGTSNGPTEAVNGRLEHLRGIALGFRNLTNYTIRSLIHAGGFRQQLLHP
ncbi:ISL3 family transposase [Actinomyces qiguomingii]|uniref:ISL3 family transposase n=1 Tax=Actinomyces qiguomingii TaxID=2057800 RepID=UPI000CA029AE|nr:ISL3 family transposase [Actinomyces qiguomingii]